MNNGNNIGPNPPGQYRLPRRAADFCQEIIGPIPFRQASDFSGNLTAATSISSTSPVSQYKYGGMEWNHTSLSYDFGARNYLTAVPRWNSMEKYYSISPYVYCTGNPVNLVDVDGRDIYYLLPDGSIKWQAPSEDHVLYAIDSERNRTNNIITLSSEYPLLNLENEGTKGVATLYTGSRTNQSELKSLFLFLSDNSPQSEWALHIESNGNTTVGTFHDEKLAGNWKMLGVKTRPKYSIHSHPGINPNKIDVISSIAGYVERNAPDAKHPFLVSGSDLDKVKKRSTDVGENYFVYFPNTKAFYQVLEEAVCRVVSPYFERYRR